MKSNKKLIIVISIVLALVVTSAVGIYAYMMTDIFRSSGELFGKYFSQNAETLKKIVNLKTLQIYEDLETKDKYESNMEVQVIHSEGGEISNPLNNLSAKIDIQKNNDEQYMYADAQVLFENEKYLETELIRQQEQYGIRFSDVAKKFVVLQNDENTKTIANEIGINDSQMETLIDMAEKNKQKEIQEQIGLLKDKYLNIITNGISNGTFTKQKNALITYNGVTTKTNEYSVVLNSEQVANIVLEILNEAKLETELFDKLQAIVDKDILINLIEESIESINEELELPSVKLVVYEQKQRTIRTVFEIGTHKIIIENSEQGAQIASSISYSDSNKTTQYNITLNKNEEGNQEKFEIVINATGDEEFSIVILNNMQMLESGININTEISHKQNITTSSIAVKNQINIDKDFEKIEVLTENNNIILNALEEETRKQFIGQLKERIPAKMNEKIKLLEEKIFQTNQIPNNTQEEEQIPQVEINKFNAKFEFYTGDEVSSENVKKLLDIVVNNLKGYEITEIDTNENTNNANSKDKKINMKLNIEKDVISQGEINTLLEKIKNNKKYKILIYYKETNGLIDYITITEI